MAKGLTLAEPPRRRTEARAEAVEVPVASTAANLFAKQREDEKVQFNKRIERHVADGYAMLAIKTGKKVPDLLREGFEALEARYGKI